MVFAPKEHTIWGSPTRAILLPMGCLVTSRDTTNKYLVQSVNDSKVGKPWSSEKDKDSNVLWKSCVLKLRVVASGELFQRANQRGRMGEKKKRTASGVETWNNLKHMSGV